MVRTLPAFTALLSVAALATLAPAAHAGPTKAPVIGGAPAAAGKWPDIVAIYSVYPGNGSTIPDVVVRACTGTLIAPTVVLTAAHCLFDEDGNIDKPVKVIIGATVAPCDDDPEDPCSTAVSNGEEIAVKQAIPHPSYGTAAGNRDLGLLVLERASTKTPRIIGSDWVTAEIKDTARIAIAGWGSLDSDASEYVPELQEAYTTITDAACASDPHGCQPELRPGGEFIAGGGGIDTCPGDSGGPVYLEVGDETYVIGVTSRGFNDGPIDVYCKDGGIYTRADSDIAWIESSTGVTLTKPPAAEGEDDGGCCQTSEGLPIGSLLPLALGALGLALPRRRRSRA